jgi:hypothetical protein
MSTSTGSRSSLCRKKKKNPQSISERDPHKQPNQPTADESRGQDEEESEDLRGTAARDEPWSGAEAAGASGAAETSSGLGRRSGGRDGIGGACVSI